jgi:DNA-binding IclR family transcriptional regulator
MAAVEKALEILKDGEWHSLDAIVTELRLEEDVVKKVLSFLAEFNFVKFDEEGKKVRIDSEFRKVCVEQ